MLVHNVDQRSPEWFALRRGIPTASMFCKIITSQGIASQQSNAYLNMLLDELISGETSDSFAGNCWTERGNELEADAVRFYERETDSEAVRVGFVTNVARTMGCSPDRLVGLDGLLEIKCPAPHTHEKYLLRQRVDSRYYAQLQGQLLITKRNWVDFLSYNPGQPHFKSRVYRDEPYLKILGELLRIFTCTLKSRAMIHLQQSEIRSNGEWTKSPKPCLESRIIMCWKCSQKLRVSAVSVELLVTCTSCGHKFGCIPN